MSDCGHMMCKSYLTITFHDGTTDRHRCYSWGIEDGVLCMREAPTGTSTSARCIPLAMIREFQSEEHR